MKRIAINGVGRTGRVMLRQFVVGYRDDTDTDTDTDTVAGFGGRR
ncbi:MAG: hypothetical protein QGI81_06885 [Pseudomonadales bacterium]|nr:hypothetical protein [Pseudomonadales bacterium]